MRNSLFLFLLAFSLAAHAYQITGQVVSVSDGDTITVLDAGKKQHRIRLHQIDAPEKRQDFGQRSRQSLADLVFGKQVTVEVAARDRYGREVGRVWVDGKDVNLEQVKLGLAWVYRRYATDPAYFAAEAEARKARLGLWSQPNPVPPWEFRHGKKSFTSWPRSPSPRVSSSAAAGGSCGAKSTCGQMTSCAEAMHYLRDCGQKHLDRDGDGIPCESLCR